jgi:FkbM family methyltransferase
MNTELKLLLGITRNLPRMRGFGVIGNVCRKFYNRKKRDFELAICNSIQMELDPYEEVDGALLFYPQLYDWKEFSFINDNLKSGQIFLDVGANIGYYSLVASSIVKEGGQIIAIEADEYNINKFERNIKLNKRENIQIVKKGVSDKKEILSINKNLSGNRGGNTFVGAVKKDDNSDIELEPLFNIISDLKLKKIDFLKIDIEGYEFRVLDKYFSTPGCVKPINILIEINLGYKNVGSDDLGILLKNHGYVRIEKFNDNSIFKLNIS